MPSNTRYHTWDKTVLEKPADFTLSLTIPKSANLPKNPDGTDPVVTLKVEGTTNRLAIATLATAHESEVIYDVVFAVLLGEEWETILEDESRADEVLAAFTKVHDQFFTVEMNATGDDDAEAKFILTAPSGDIAVKAFQALTRKDKLNGLIASLMPEDDDFYD